MGGLILRGLAALFVVAALGGCESSQGFDRGRMNQQLSANAPKATDEEISRVMGLRPQLDFPIRLAIYVKPREYYWHDPVWRIEDIDAAWLETLKRGGLVTEVIPIVESTVTGDSIADIRLAAARHGADAVLVLESVSDVDRYNNPLGMTYFTIVGAWLIPGTHSDALVMMSGSLWDVRNGYLYATMQTEGEASDFGPAFLLEDYKVVAKAHRAALTGLESEITKRLRNIAPRAVQ
jgi:hypothetical protein